MKYNQQFLDELNQKIPYRFWSELEESINKGKHQKNRIPLSTIKDTLRVAREGGTRGRSVIVDKESIIDKAVELLEAKGIVVNN